MRADLDLGLEIIKLARLIGCRPEEIDYLELLEPQDIRDLREQVTGALFDADRQLLGRVAAASKLLPSKLTAAIGESVFGPLLCARLTGVLDPHRAVEIAARMPAGFLADVTQHLDPRRASRVIGALPAEQVADITEELVRREQYITMGSVVGHLSKAATEAALDVIDDEALLRTAYVVESKGSLGSLVALLPEERLESIIRTASEDGLWTEALDVMGHVSERQRGELAEIAAAQDDEVLEGLVRAAQKDDLWGVLLPVTRAMNTVSRERFVQLPSIQTRTVLAAIVDAAAREALWADLLAFLPLLPAPARRRVAALATALRPMFSAIIAAAHDEQLWPALVAFAAELDEATQRRIAELIAAEDEEVLAGLFGAVESDGLERESLTVLARLTPAKQRAFAKRVAAVASVDGLLALAEAAEGAELEVLRRALAPEPAPAAAVRKPRAKAARS
ncbi:MAG: hypothetical protein QOJ25_623 [Solirubrobacteraceae bacterium]|jgi:hypothetical protein|nr:hypothetical protein [Solirubrobacteraceae bacterium]